VVALSTIWITRKRIENLRIEVPGGTIKGGTAEDAERREHMVDDVRNECIWLLGSDDQPQKLIQYPSSTK
jgi:hypothetical protein